MGNMLGIDIQGKHVLLSTEYTDEEIPERRVYLATWGNGTHPNTIGNAVFATQVATGLEKRVEGYMLEPELATTEQVEAAEQYLRDNPPPKFSFDDFRFDEDGTEYVQIPVKLNYPVDFKISGLEGELNTMMMKMDMEALESWSVHFVIRDISEAWKKITKTKKLPDIDVEKIERHMIEYAKCWLARKIAKVEQQPIKIELNLEELTEEQLAVLKEKSAQVREYLSLEKIGVEKIESN